MGPARRHHPRARLKPTAKRPSRGRPSAGTTAVALLGVLTGVVGAAKHYRLTDRVATLMNPTPAGQLVGSSAPFSPHRL